MENKWGLNTSSLLKPQFATSDAPGSPRKDLSLESARQFAQAVDDMLTKYPFLDLDAIRASYNGQASGAKAARSNAFAQADAKWDASMGEWIYSGKAKHVTLNAPMASDQDRALMALAYKNGRRDSETRDYNPDAMARPVYYTIIHEMGHVMDYNGKTAARRRVLDAISDEFRKTPEGKANDGTAQFQPLLNDWLRTRLVSAYSFTKSDRTKGIYVPEAIAEAFLDVELRGNRAKDLSKIIHQIVVEEAKKNRGVK